MTHGTVLVWDLAGRPDAPTPALYDDAPAVCAACARTVDHSAPAAKALGANFTDPALWSRPASDRICAACQWCCAGRPPATIRGWTVVAAPGARLAPSQPKVWALLRDRPGLCVTNRAATAPVAAILLDPPAGEWLVAVAVSGQKHTLPYARTNRGPGSWTVRMENTDVTSDPGEWRRVLGHAARLRHAGHAADLIRDGAPDLRAIKTTADITACRPHLDALARYRRAPLLDLALWCLTKPTVPTYAEI